MPVNVYNTLFNCGAATDGHIEGGNLLVEVLIERLDQVVLAGGISSELLEKVYVASDGYFQPYSFGFLSKMLESGVVQERM